MVGERPPCTQKIWLSTTADKLQQGTSKQHGSKRVSNPMQPARQCAWYLLHDGCRTTVVLTLRHMLANAM
jgi:hypothetical protein